MDIHHLIVNYINFNTVFETKSMHEVNEEEYDQYPRFRAQRFNLAEERNRDPIGADDFKLEDEEKREIRIYKIYRNHSKLLNNEDKVPDKRFDPPMDNAQPLVPLRNIADFDQNKAKINEFKE